MTAEGCRQWRESLGVYALGQLDGPERVALEAHLEGCPGCSEEVASLAGVAEVLPMADPQRLGSAPEPSAGLARRIAAEIAAERRSARRRRRFNFGLAFGAAAAAAAAVRLPGAPRRQQRALAAGRLRFPAARDADLGGARAAPLRHPDPDAGEWGPLRHALPGLPAPRRRRTGRRRHVPLPLRRRLRGDAELCPRPLPGRGDRGARRRPHLPGADRGLADHSPRSGTDEYEKENA